ncbi:Protein kinase domain family protein [Babesia bovis T2Bo]|uniref:Protein kinase domain-containing protein n=1 Tax=Babesia bovis TaxID=5865 RepID=A7AR06_BABBO|nr:Protein kinase domain family protein [Babesia bovis T2Bo]EDO06975.1 Protein kinase domain family protein [Babesia bovis T2Bo]|eukprot:XP_001610543.1 hypothetical protein [Babesia bovis T2Bo]
MEDEELTAELQAQLDEIHALHYIFFPATVLQRGRIPQHMLADDIFPVEEYASLLSQLTVRTSIELNTHSSDCLDAANLVKVGFRVSPYHGDYSRNLEMPQSFIEVTFPPEYPQNPPGLSIVMNMALSQTTVQEVVQRIQNVISNTDDGACVFNATMCLNEMLGDVHAKLYKLWDDTGTALAITFSESMREQVTDSERKPGYGNIDKYTKSGFESPMYSGRPVYSGQQSEKTQSGSMDMNITPTGIRSFNDTTMVEREMYSSSVDIAGWSLQSLIQAPLWYEGGLKMNEDNTKDNTAYNLRRQRSYISSEEQLWKPYGRTETPGNLISQRTWSYDETPEFQNASIDHSSAHTRLDIDSSNKPEHNAECQLDPETSMAITRTITMLSAMTMSSNIERYRQDFADAITMTQTPFSKFLKARHALDQNMYILRTYELPSFCVLKTQRDISTPKEESEHFKMRRNVIVQQLVATVASLARLQHNSLGRYYHCWVEKVQQHEKVKVLMQRAEALTTGTANVVTTEPAEHEALELWMHDMLLKGNNLDDPGYIEFLLDEAVIRRRLYIQMEHCDGKTLNRVIQTDGLYKNPQLIWTFTRHLLDVLAYLHSNNAYHQALSLKNVIVYSNAQGAGVKVCEFGVARLLRQFCHKDFFCLHNKCKCRDYSKQLSRELFAYHPLAFGVEPIDYEEMENCSDVEAQQEDMFALGVLLFRMWHPPLEEKQFKEMFTTVINTQKFPPYFSHSTPNIILKTILRLVSPGRKPTAVELLSETLVPPVMNSDLYNQYLRRLQNPSSEEAVGALKFMLKRGWKADVTRLRADVPIKEIVVMAAVIEGLETFMRKRSVIVESPQVLYPVTQNTERNGIVTVLDETNTLLKLPNNIIKAVEENLKYITNNEYRLYYRCFNVTQIYTKHGTKIAAMYSCVLPPSKQQMTYTQLGIKRTKGAMPVPEAKQRQIGIECDVINTAMESLKSLPLGENITMVIQLPPLVVVFIALAFSTDIEKAHHIYTNLAIMDVNQFTLSKLLNDLNVCNDTVDEKLVATMADILRRRQTLPEALLQMQAIVTSTTRSFDTHLADMFKKVEAQLTIFFPDNLCACNYRVCNRKDQTNDNTDMLATSIYLNQEQYLTGMLHLLGIAIMIKDMQPENKIYMDFITESQVASLCEGSIDYPMFAGYIEQPTKKIVVIGGTVINDDGQQHCYAEYILETLCNAVRPRPYDVDSNDNKGIQVVDVVITSCSVKLLPAAMALANRLIDTGLSCDCRALPLIHTDHFNDRIKRAGSVKMRVHLQSSGTTTPNVTVNDQGTISNNEMVTSDSWHDDREWDDTGDLQPMDTWQSKLDVTNKKNKGNIPNADYELINDTKKQTSGTIEYEDDKMFTGISFQVEPLKDKYGHTRKIDSLPTLVRYLKSLLSRDNKTTNE